MKKLLIITLLISNISCEKEVLNTLNSDNIVKSNSFDELSIMMNQNSIKNSSLNLDVNQLRKEYLKPRSQWIKPNLDPEIKHNEIGNIEQVKFPKNNTYSLDKYNLGRMLFFEAKLSKNNSMSCSSCHNPNIGWADNLQSSIGLDNQPLKRNSPSILNSVFHENQFWDSRAKSLEEQAKMVLLNPKEMDSSEDLVKENLSNSLIYKNLFKKAFGSEEINLDKISQSIATFERSIITKNKSNFDQFIMGKSDALTDSQVRGLHIFRTTGRCMNCHNGSNFTDNKMHNIGLVMEGSKYEDKGKYEITKNEEDFGLFKTPSLRNISKTPPYFHNGLVLNLKGLINIYSNGMPNSKNKSKHIRPIGLEKQDREDLISFIESLSEDVSINNK